MSVFFAFTFFVFGSVQLYLQNITQFEFSILDLLPPVCIAFLLFGGIVFCVGFFLHGKWLEWYLYLVFGGTLALYIQGNFIITDYGPLNGVPIAWENYQTTALLNTILWIACLALPFILKCILKKNILHMLSLVVGCITIVQVIALGSLFLTTDLKSHKVTDFYLSDNGVHSVSQEDNVVVFVLDTFDAKYMDAILEQEPDFFEPLDGFTNYRNATSEYPHTLMAVPYLLTGQNYKNEQPYTDFIEGAYLQTDIYDTLMASGYDLGVYTGAENVSKSFSKTHLINAVFEPKSVTSYFSLGLKMFKFTSFKYFPHILKPIAWLSTGTFDELMGAPEGMPQPWSYDNVTYYNSLVKNGLSANETNKSFRFIHLNGPHGPFNMTENVTNLPEKGTGNAYTESKASMKIVFQYLSELKRLGVYGQTSIYVLADHGANYIGDFYRGNIQLLHKPKDSYGALQHSNAPVAQTDLWPTILKEMGSSLQVDFGIPLSDVPEDSQRIRKHYHFMSWNSEDGKYLDPIRVFDIMPNNRELGHYIETDVVYEKPKK